MRLVVYFYWTAPTYNISTEKELHHNICSVEKNKELKKSFYPYRDHVIPSF